MFTTYTVADFRPQSAKHLRALPSPTAVPFAATPTASGTTALVAPESDVPSAAPAPKIGKSGWKSTKLGSFMPFAPVPSNIELADNCGTAATQAFGPELQPSGLGTALPSGLQRIPIDAAGVQAVLAPEDWEQHKSNLPPGYGSIQTIGPVSKKLTIGIADRGQPLSPIGLRNFMTVLATADGATKSRPLLPSQIRSLSELLGKASIGDNQHTNTNRWAPYTFKMFSASAFIVNGRPVLEVEGQFVDVNGQRVRDHIGLYTLQRNRVTRIFLDATSKDDYIYGRWLYKYLLKTIEWS